MIDFTKKYSNVKTENVSPKCKSITITLEKDKVGYLLKEIRDHDPNLNVFTQDDGDVSHVNFVLEE